MKKALIVVDVQKDFVEGGTLAVEGGQKVADDIVAFIEQAGQAEIYEIMVATKDWHINPKGHWSDTPDFKDTWPVHCEAGKQGSWFANPKLNTIFTPQLTFLKGAFEPAYSGFEGRNVDLYLINDAFRALDITEVDVVGLAYDYCVAATAVEAAQNGYKTRILTSLTQPVHKEPEFIEKLTKNLMLANVELVL